MEFDYNVNLVYDCHFYGKKFQDGCQITRKLHNLFLWLARPHQNRWMLLYRPPLTDEGNIWCAKAYQTSNFIWICSFCRLPVAKNHNFAALYVCSTQVQRETVSVAEPLHSRQHACKTPNAVNTRRERESWREGGGQGSRIGEGWGLSLIHISEPTRPY